MGVPGKDVSPKGLREFESRPLRKNNETPLRRFVILPEQPTAWLTARFERQAISRSTEYEVSQSLKFD